MKRYRRKYVFDKEGNKLSLKERTYKTNEGYDLEVIDGGSKEGYVTAKIGGYIFEARDGSIKKGCIKYPFHPSVFGRGYFGEGKYKAKENGKNTKVYALWNNMLQRAYDKNYHNKYPTYKNVEVCEEWYNFQNFANWFYKESNYKEGWQLDKDLLSGSKKIYSPQTCIFIPASLNAFFTNKQTSNTSGCIGVSWSKQKKKWKVSINNIEAGKRKYLGYFNDIEEAAKAYKEARKEQAQIWQDRMKGILPDNAVRNIV